MTDQELKDLVASLSIDAKEIRAMFKETDAKFKETDAKFKETDAKFKETDAKFKETDAKFKETDAKLEKIITTIKEFTESAREKEAMNKNDIEEIRQQLKESAQQIRELGQQIGGVTNKFGTFTEGLSLPSVQKLLFTRFGVEDFMPRRRKRVGPETIELDALGVVNGERNEGYVVEIKSHLRKEAVQQMLTILGRFRDLFTEYKHLKLYGIIVAADASQEALREALEAGFYVITFEDDIMRFYDEPDFTVKAY